MVLRHIYDSHDQAKLSGNRGMGSVTMRDNSTVAASFHGTGGFFEVRRLA